MILLTFVFIVLFYLIIEYFKNVRLGIKLAKHHFKEVPYIPLLGDYHLFPTNEGMAGIFRCMMNFHQKYGKDLISRGLLNEINLQVTDPKTVEKILLSKNIKKGHIYTFAEDWLGTGLILSFGEKWAIRRKILTPAFHFKVLEQFLNVFEENEDRFVQKLEKHVGGDEFNIYDYVMLMTLDAICETSMGVHVNALDNPNNEYVHAVKGEAIVIFRRIFSIFKSYKKFFPFTKLYWEQKRLLTILHSFTDKVIRDRRQLLQNQKAIKDVHDDADDDTLVKKKMSLLDLLLNMSEKGTTTLSDADIREEVDTFMFAGHDTTTSGISYTIYQLSKCQDVQEKVYEEMLSVIGSDPKSVKLTSSLLNQMKYLEMVLKETLRLYPSVPMIGRTTMEDIQLDNGAVIPEGTEVTVCIYQMHRDEDLYPDPLKFDPERFTEENQSKRKPYDYIPFSAGQRNCIGQKYALLEMKSTVVKFLSHYKILPSDKTVELQADLVLRPVDGVYVKIIKREN